MPRVGGRAMHSGPAAMLYLHRHAPDARSKARPPCDDRAVLPAVETDQAASGSAFCLRFLRHAITPPPIEAEAKSGSAAGTRASVASRAPSGCRTSPGSHARGSQRDYGGRRRADSRLPKGCGSGLVSGARIDAAGITRSHYPLLAHQRGRWW
jgi:hypothetical protein